MDEVYTLEAGRRGAHMTEPLGELGSIGMCAVAVDDLDVRPERHIVTEDPQHGLALDYPATKSVLRLKSDDEDRVARVGRAVCEVMQDSPGFHHARGSD